jgi:peptidoglycan/LPS O-acetylase OafA/YrhL
MTPGLDLVRGICAITVMIAHTEYWLDRALDLDRTYLMRPVGFMAVEFFFVLSGMLLGPIMLQALERLPRINLRIFVVRRAFRTLPLYFLALAAYAIVDSGPGREQIATYAFFSQNLFTSMPLFFSVSWSLSVEEWYYLTAPLLLAASMALLPHATNLQRFRWCMLLLVVAAFALRLVYVSEYGNWDQDIRKVVVLRVDAIAVGALLGSFAIQMNARHAWIAAGTLSAIALGLGLFWTGFNAYSEVISVKIALSLLFAVVPVCIFFVIRWSELQFKTRFRKAARFFADISYPLYLFHIPVLVVFAGYFGDTSLTGLIAYYVISVLLAYALHRAIERPVMSLRPQFAQESAPITITAQDSRAA